MKLNNRFSDAPADWLPGPSARGNLGATWRFTRFMLQPFPTFQRHLSTYGPVSGLTGAIKPGGQGLILAIGPQYNQQVLSNPSLFYNMGSSNVPKTSAAWRLAQGVVYLNGEHHRQQRRLIMPSFHKKEIDRYAEAMVAATERLMDGYHFAAQSSVMLSHYMTHRLPTIYAEPDRFLPERWFTFKPSPYEYIPFSGGPRLCIGAQFAMLEMKLALATIVQRYRLTPPVNASIKTSINFLLRVKQMPMIVHAQDGQFTKTLVRGDVLKLVSLP